MICLKGDLVVNDNMWVRLMTTAYGDDFNVKTVDIDEVKPEVLAAGDTFIETFDKVCRKHGIKKVYQFSPKQVFPQKLKILLQVVKRYSK